MYTEKWVFYKKQKKVLTQIRYAKDKENMNRYYKEQLKNMPDVKIERLPHTTIKFPSTINKKRIKKIK